MSFPRSIPFLIGMWAAGLCALSVPVILATMMPGSQGLASAVELDVLEWIVVALVSGVWLFAAAWLVRLTKEWAAYRRYMHDE